MPQDEPSGPDLLGVVADAEAVGLEYVVIGGFSVIYHGHVRATKDSDLLVPDGPDADAAVLRFVERVNGRRLCDDKVITLEDLAGGEHLRIDSRHGIVDIMRGGCHLWTTPPSLAELRRPSGTDSWYGSPPFPASSASSAWLDDRRTVWILKSSKRSMTSSRSSRYRDSTSNAISRAPVLVTVRAWPRR
jgi:hypothetical protein